MRRSWVKAAASTVALVALLAAGAHRLRHIQDLETIHVMGKAASRCAGPLCPAGGLDDIVMPVSAPVVPPSRPLGVVAARQWAPHLHVFEIRRHIRPPPYC